MDNDLSVLHEIPEPEEYVSLRAAAGLSPKPVSVARDALRRSIFAVVLRRSDQQLIGMGRLIGDGGCFFQIVDIAVDPSCQGKGYGKLIMSEITNYLDGNMPQGAFVSLIADVPADQLYQQYGFEYTHPKSVGMYRKF
ncbi:GNAT family N-acetyltransferase [Paenibacillus kobensis]|uniref:GNAT family N-acetyltransferase n=1 Tax=Paenibacillus kobensis TaxID=59841 RepID=UPI000FD8B67B|nr:GNAT family N-acetyltransferase [Paenibacillus kobensis]